MSPAKVQRFYETAKEKPKKFGGRDNYSYLFIRTFAFELLLKEIGIMGIIPPSGQAYYSNYSNFFHFLLFGFLSTLSRSRNYKNAQDGIV